jgi:hypothetical protein
MYSYSILVIYPGMYSLKYKVIADYFTTDEGIYKFMINAEPENEIVQTFPLVLTIIEKIEKYE